MRGLILSGGRGTRLRPITFTSAKQLVPVANKPILFYGLEALAASGIREIGIVVGDTHQEIRDAVGDGSRWGVVVTYIPQSAPLGLAHAVLTAEEYLRGEPFVMYLGDNLIRESLAPLVARFRTETPNAQILLAKVPNPQEFGVAELSGGKLGYIHIPSMDEDGREDGYDLELLRAITRAVRIPVIASGGAGAPQHFVDAVCEADADAVLAASIFHFRKYRIEEVKAYMAAHGIPVRRLDSAARPGPADEVRQSVRPAGPEGAAGGADAEGA